MRAGSRGSVAILPPYDQPSTPEVTRRSFLRTAALSAATAAVVADGLVAYRAYDSGVMASGHGPAFAAWRQWPEAEGPTALVAAAVLAASAHNTQPWLFGVTGETVEVYADLNRTTGANDPLLRELHVSLGCALENLVLTARAQGYTADVTFGAGPPEAVASVSLRPGRPTTSSLSEAIGHRRSNRARFRPLPDVTATVEAMDSLVDASVRPARVVWLSGADERRRFADLLIDATRAHVGDDVQSQDSFAWWRSNWDSIQRHKDGLTIDGAGLPSIKRALGKLLPAPTRAAADSAFVDQTIVQAGSAPLFGVVVTDDPSSLSERLAGGRLIQRLHLWATAHELGFQHMNQITERVDRDQQLGRPNPFLGPLGELVGPGGPLAAFRVGTPTRTSPPSPRRPALEVLR